MKPEAGNELSDQSRHLRPAARAAYEPLGNRWAVIVGISDHQHGVRNLEYAHRDARELCKLLQTPSGGGFEKDRIKELINAEATTANIGRALRGFLKKPAPQDLVLIYFACHGAPDPERPKNLYLITYDTDPADIAGTALPMREVHLALTETLLAERVVIIADTCHSAGLGGGLRDLGNDAQVINAFLREASQTKGGVALLTSAQASEVSREGKEWGGGHGVFTMLLDAAATCEGILQALAELAQKTTAADTVIVHYSGHSVPESQRRIFGAEPGASLYLIVHDSIEEAGRLKQGITHTELHEAMMAIPAEHKTLVLDTHPCVPFNQLVERDGGYALLLASDSAEMSSESQVEIDGELQMAGLFTATLTQYLAVADLRTLTYGQLINAVIAGAKEVERRQTPLLIGDREQLVFAREEVYLSLFEFARRRNYAPFTAEGLQARYARFRRQVTAPLPQAHHSFGRALLEKGKHEAAMEALQTALAQRGEDDAEMLLALGKAQFGAELYQEALATLQRYARSAPAETAAAAPALIAQAEKWATGRRHALLVGINKYLNPETTPVRGAVNDVRMWREVLERKFGFAPERTTALLDREATRDAILAAFQQLVAAAREEPALFFFAGNGSLTPGDGLALVSADGRQDGVYDIALQELAALAGDAPNLISILDAGWVRYPKPGAGLRAIPLDTRERPANRGAAIDDARQAVMRPLRVGALTIYNLRALGLTEDEPQALESNTPSPAAPRSRTKTISGLLTRGLVGALAEAAAPRLTYDAWLEAAAEHMPFPDPFKVVGKMLDEPVFANRAMRANAFDLLARIEQAPIKQAIAALRRMIEQREQQGDLYPQGRLNLGVAYAAQGDYDRSLEYLKDAVMRYENETVMERERERDRRADAHHHEARYQLGRVLFESKRSFSGAVSELDNALKLNPENTRAYYYLGQAIRAMVERETLTRADEALRTYLTKGAPLGHEDEVRGYLGSRAKRAHAAWEATDE